MKFPPFLKTAKFRGDPLFLSPFTAASVSSVLLAGLVVTGLLLSLKSFSGLQALELTMYDWMIRFRPQKAFDPRLLIVGITETDIQNQQRWPLSDLVVAQLLEKLQQYQPQVIGLDLYRDIPYPPGHQQLLQQLQADNVVAIYELGFGAEHGVSVPPPPGIPKQRLGFNDIVLDVDDVLRRNLLYAQSPSGEQKAYSFSLQVSRRYLGRDILVRATDDALQMGDRSPLSRLRANSGAYRLDPLEAEGWQILLKYRSNKVARQVSLSEALNGEIKPSWVRNNIVLVGTTAPSEKDLFLTPYNRRISGVEAHAHNISQILSIILDGEPQTWFWSDQGEWLWIWGWSLVGGALVWYLQRPLLICGGFIVALGGLWGISYAVFVNFGWIPVATPALALIATGGGILANKVFYSIYYDPLTGLANRSLFIKKLKQIGQRKRQQTLAVIVFDFDRFKLINDSLGYRVGDRFLIAAARRLRSASPQQGRVARVGGNEFALCLSSSNSQGEAIRVANDLYEQVTLPYRVDGQKIYTTVSVGVAYGNAKPWSNRKKRGWLASLNPLELSKTNAEELLRNAQIAMYRAKALGKMRPEVFETQMHTQTVERWHLEADLRRAVEQKEFELFYQPIVYLETGEIAGFEALVRWQSSQRGLVLPSEFIPIAEETGLIVPLGQMILRQACLQTKQWQEQFSQIPLTMSVNLSRRQFSQPELLREIKQVLEDVGLKSQSLKLEITESAIAEDIEAAIALLRQLKALNLRLSIDDFGTGYSSFSALHHFPIDTLKVDKSFVSRIEDSRKYAEITSTIIMLGHNLGMDVIAEGIETATQKQKLQALGCKYGQGYFFARPLCAEAATALLKSVPSSLH